MPMALVLENAMVIHVGGVFHRPAMQLLGLLPVLLALLLHPSVEFFLCAEISIELFNPEVLEGAVPEEILLCGVQEIL